MALRFACALLLGALCLSSPALGQPTPQPITDWQQAVAYEMDVTVLADRHQLRGTQRLRYTNNSPDTLRHVYYHLYFNAFQPQSMMAERNRHLPDPDGRVVPRIFNLGPDEIGYHRVQSLTQGGTPVDFEVNDTVLRVDLAAPIRPGETAVFEMTFRSQVPLQTRRSGRDNREGIDFSMSQWYPKMAEYDSRGWHADPYIGREFYAPFGTFDVRLTLPSAYTVGSTGVLQNPQEAGHGYEQSGTWRPGDATFADTDSTTWRFTAEAVHDFAWAADPDYIHEQIDAALPGGAAVTYHLLYQPDVADRWQPMSDWVPDLISFFSEQYGDYAYPQFTVAQAGDGGMEYPMINFLTGRRSPGSLLGVTAHEAAHEWFYAVLANNEADYAWMDEGFTSYATEEGVAHVQGRPANHLGSYLGVVSVQERGLYERANTPADWFTTNVGYGVASYTTGAMLVDMLGYVMGERERDEFIRAYYDRYAFDHPDPYDVETVAESVSGLRLDWYFEQVLNLTRELDYAVADLRAEQAGGGWQATLKLERKGEMVMPADVRLTLEDGSTRWVHVPLVIMQGHKPMGEGWTVAEPWPWTYPEWTVTVGDLPARPVKAELDPRGQTPDGNRLNNTSGFPVSAAFLEAPSFDWFNYSVGYRPLAQYAHDFGPAVGAQARGQYIFGQHRFTGTLKLWPQVLFSGGEEPELPFEELRSDDGTEVPADVSWFDGLDYGLEYALNLPTFGPRAELLFDFQKHLGFLENRLTLAKPLDGYGSDYDMDLNVSLIHQLNPTDRVFGAIAKTYPTFVCPINAICNAPEAGESFLNPFQREHMISARISYAVEDGADRIGVAAEVGTSLMNQRSVDRQSVSMLALDATKSLPLGPLNLNAGFHFGLGDERLVLHKQFRLGAASFEQRWRDDAFRSAAAVFDRPLEDAHLAAFSGVGPVAYLLGDPSTDNPVRLGGAPLGTRLVAGSLTLSSGRLGQNRWLRPLRFDAFSGIGQVWSDGHFLAGFEADDLVADAGLGARYDVSRLGALDRWTAQSDVLSGLQFVAKFPLWASDPGLIDAGEDEFAFRWLLGIQTGF